MVFLIHKISTIYDVIVYDSISDLTSRVEWQDIFEGKSIIIDQNGLEYEWDSSKENEKGTIYNYTLIPTSRVSNLVNECLEKIRLNQNIQEFTFKIND